MSEDTLPGHRRRRRAARGRPSPDAPRAVAGGVLAGVVTSVLLLVARRLGVDAHLEATIGAALAPIGALSFAAGLVLHLAISGVLGWLYALAFERVLHRAGWRAGVALCPLHLALTALAMSAGVRIHPRIPTIIPNPGLFLTASGLAGVLTVLAVHVAFGAVVGAFYRTTAPAPSRAR